MAAAANQNNTGDKHLSSRDRVRGETAHAAMLEFLGMEQNLKAAARHLAAAERSGGAAKGAAELAEIAARLTLERNCPMT
jgi:hypothetical protein